MKLNYILHEAFFIDRPNRFITRVMFNGEIVKSYLPDPGRLDNLLIKGSKVLIKNEYGLNRKTSFSTQAIYRDNILISLNTLLPNKLLKYLLENKKIEFLKGWNLYKTEVKYNKHRFDFELIKEKDNLILEVKSVTLVDKKIAKFPDSVTSRGRMHVEYLGEMAEKGINAMIIFVVQRHDPKLFKPEWNRDPKFCLALYNAWKKGLEIRVVKTKITQKKIIYLGEIPFNLK